MGAKGKFLGMRAALRTVFGTNERLRAEASASSAAQSIDRLIVELQKPIPVLSLDEALRHVAGEEDA